MIKTKESKLSSQQRRKLLKFLTYEKVNGKPTEAVIGIHTKADLSRYGGIEEYAYEKTQDLLDASVEKVIWIFTKTKKVMIAEKGKKWIVKNWKDDFEVMEGIRLNISEILKREE